jgi:hypothetical protein
MMGRNVLQQQQLLLQEKVAGREREREGERERRREREGG